jgi:hypothetical protein
MLGLLRRGIKASGRLGCEVSKAVAEFVAARQQEPSTFHLSYSYAAAAPWPRSWRGHFSFEPPGPRKFGA